MPRRIEEHADVFSRLTLGEGRAEVYGVGHGTGQVVYRDVDMHLIFRVSR